jgi:hypothetical protein
VLAGVEPMAAVNDMLNQVNSELCELILAPPCYSGMHYVQTLELLPLLMRWIQGL